MKKLIFLITFTIVTGSMLAGWRSLPLAAAIRSDLPGLPISRVSHRNENLANNHPRPIDASGPLCAKPRPDEVAGCDQLEQQILASTVRLVWHRRIKNDDGHTYTFVEGGTALTTIKEGRYLVTHNHSGISPSDLKTWESITGFVSTSNGELIWLGAPLEAVTVAVEDPETLVLDFGSDSGQGFFDSLGLASAEFKAWDSFPLQPGTEVAQVNWDGTTAQVDWITIEKVITERGVPRLELANVVRPGASGGGVFWNGYHIANTRSQVTAYGENSGVVLREYSVAALNSSQVAGTITEGQR